MKRNLRPSYANSFNRKPLLPRRPSATKHRPNRQLKDGTFISQTKYTQDLIKRFGMKDAKPAKTPMGTDGHTDLNKGGKSVDQKAYRSMIGSLLYLCASRPDIMLSVCMCARFQSDPKECHLVAVKRILRYLVATPCFGI
jgi:hypothetical protein